MTLQQAINRIAGCQGQITFCFNPDRVIVTVLNPQQRFEEPVSYMPDDPEGISIPAVITKIAKLVE